MSFLLQHYIILFCEFLNKILGYLISEANAPNKIFKIKHPARITVSNDSILSDLSQYAETPECLKKFLKSVV